jgi:ankyrin repeat protein
LRKRIRMSQPHSIERQLACLEFLQSKGLVRRRACGELNADGEDVIMVAGGDGWSANDVDALLEAGADVAAADGNGQTSIWNAASCGHAVTLCALLAGGGFADSCINSNERNVSLGQAGAAAVWIAACNGHADCVQILIEAKADLDKESSDHQMTPTYMASQNGHLACLQALLSAGANLSKCEE